MYVYVVKSEQDRYGKNLTKERVDPRIDFSNWRKTVVPRSEKKLTLIVEVLTRTVSRRYPPLHFQPSLFD